MKLYLDDYRRPPQGEGYVASDNYADFLALLDKHRDCLEVVDLDYDLGWDSLYNGYHVLTYMKRHDMTPEHINIHSTHVSGRDKMLKYAITNFPGAVVTGWADRYRG